MTTSHRGLPLASPARILALAVALACALATTSCVALDVALDPSKRGCWSTSSPSTSASAPDATTLNNERARTD